MSKQTTKEHLIEVGLGLVRSSGYTATGINQVLETAHVPKGSFYHHFATKDEFVMEVIRRYFAGEQQRAERILFDESVPSPKKRLESYFKDLIAVYGQRGGTIAGCLLGNLSLEVGAQNDGIRALLRQCFDGWQQAIATTLRAAIERREIPETLKPDDMAALLVNGWEGAQVRAKAEQNDKPLELFYDNAFGVLLRK